MQHTILVVDDDQMILTATKNALERSGYVVHTATSGEIAIEKVSLSPNLYALVILDIRMPGKDGSVTAKELIAINPDIYILIYSGFVNLSFRVGQVEVIEKGVASETLLKTVGNWCRKYDETTRVLAPSPKHCDFEKEIAAIGLIGRSEALASIVRTIKKLEAEQSDLNVLLLGESGTGKGIIAKAIHQHSLRKNNPFVPLNCGAIPENLIESELFGHERGSFTGAEQKKIGLFQFAERGTLLMDEIAEMTLTAQVRLLRALQEKEIKPVGSNRSLPINVRVIAATHQDLEKLSQDKKFRLDLYYRLNVITIELPPLRHRPEDIEPLIEYYCEVFNKKSPKKRTFLMSTVKLLERYPWPGNVRELEHAVLSILTKSFSDKVGPDSIPSKYWEKRNAFASTHHELQQKHQIEERQLLRTALAGARSQREAAKKLEMPFSSFKNALKRLGLENPVQEFSHESETA